jgi:DNA-binding response OmpR family regulator
MQAHILIVDDDDRMRRALATRLEYAGYRVTQAQNGEQALQLLEGTIFDVVLTDVVMRSVDGVEVLHTARLQAYRPAVILLTAYGSLETSLAALRKGAYDYLLKPVTPAELLECVRGAIQRRQTEQSVREATSMFYEQGENAPSQLGSETTAPTETSATAQTSSHLCIGPLSIGSSRYDVHLHGTPIDLTPIEHALLRCLAYEPGKLHRYSDIVRSTHALDVDDSEAHTLLRSHISNLRKKLGKGYLVNRRGRGYILVDPHQTV